MASASFYTSTQTQNQAHTHTHTTAYWWKYWWWCALINALRLLIFRAGFLRGNQKKTENTHIQREEREVQCLIALNSSVWHASDTQRGREAVNWIKTAAFCSTARPVSPSDMGFLAKTKRGRIRATVSPAEKKRPVQSSVCLSVSGGQMRKEWEEGRRAAHDREEPFDAVHACMMISSLVQWPNSPERIWPTKKNHTIEKSCDIYFRLATSTTAFFGGLYLPPTRRRLD